MIRNNRNTEGAGISLIHYADIEVDGELFLVNNTAETRGGAILLEQPCGLFNMKDHYAH